MVTLRVFITLENINSQIVQVLGFIRLGRMPNNRNGTEATPRKGTGKCICCQQPMQIFDWCSGMGFSDFAVANRVLERHSFA
jgi:hypothetical protein